MNDIFAELQRLTLSTNEVQQTRETLNKLVDWFKSRPNYLDEVDMFAELRQLDKQTLLDADAFMIQPEVHISDIPEEFHGEYLGLIHNNYIVYSGRFVYPVKDVKGNVAGFCGYDKFDDNKYLDSKNHGYKAKEAMLYGMERIEEYYRSDEPVFITEGIVCTLWLRQNGFQALALLGSNITPYVATILKRFGKRAVIIPDSDEAGNYLMRLASRLLPKARILQSAVAKDVDDSRKIKPDLAEDLHKAYLHLPQKSFTEKLFLSGKNKRTTYI